jgi:hypothetical protein
MNTEQTTNNRRTAIRTFTTICLSSCRKVVAQIEKVKDTILSEFRSYGTHERLLRLALNEAEALAWQTDFPHLVFPMLATEKAQSVVAWNGRQRTARQSFARLQRAG